MIAASDSIRCLNGQDVKEETRLYLKQLIKRGLRPPSTESGTKVLEHHGHHGDGHQFHGFMPPTAGTWPLDGSMSPLPSSHRRSTGSKPGVNCCEDEQAGLGGNELMVCVGAAVGNCNSSVSNNAHGVQENTLCATERPQYGQLLVSGGNSTAQAQPGGLKDPSASRPKVLTRKKGIFRP